MPVFSVIKDGRSRYLVAVGLLILGADQLTKFLVKSNMVVGQSVPEDSPVRLHYIQNTGSAFGLFANQTIILTIAAALGILVIGFFFFRGSGATTLFGLSLIMQLSGAIGNIIDRVAYGYVIDFIDFRIWPIFNVADSSITIGFL
ncbi:MAG: signal peptidase II, partial [Dehalococcoidia bacterium]